MRAYVCTEVTHTSKYVGVSWNQHNQKWQASIFVNKKKKHGGCYTSELDAGHGVNVLCDDHGVGRKNPDLGDPPSDWKVRSLSITLVCFCDI